MRDGLGLTPSQTAGPYLSIGLLREPVPTELVAPGDPRAIRIRGRLLDGAGEGVPDGMVEIWQADEDGRYGASAARAPRTQDGSSSSR
jgi:protocatechuate 3,4-dioxygenase, alpha subunit